MADSNITRNAMAAAMKALMKKKSFPRSAFPIYAEHAV